MDQQQRRGRRTISAGADERGLLDFTPLNETAAQTAMAELRLAQ